MKKLYALILVVFLTQLSFAQVINFPDAVFKSKLLATSATSNTAQNLVGVNFKIDANNNGEIEVSEAQQVSGLYMIGSPVNITSFEGILNFTNLKNFTSTLNNTAVVNLSGLQLLEYFDCKSTHVVNLDVSNCPNLTYLNAGLNEISGFNMTGCTNLETLDLAFCSSLETLDVSNYTNLTKVDCKQCSSLASINVSGCTNLKNLACNQSLITNLDVSGLANLETLDAFHCPLTAVNLAGCTKLKNLQCYQNALTTLNLNGLSSLEILNAGGGNLTALSFEGCTNLKEMHLDSNPLTTFDPRSLLSLEKLIISTCELTSLYLSGMPQLKTLDAYSNNLTSIDFSNLTALTSVQLGFNNFTTLDFSGCPALFGAGCLYNPALTTINAKNGGNLFPAFNVTNPNLVYICANENNVAQIQAKINSEALVNCHTNSYCSFNPGGTYYTIQGNVKFDALQNGCDAADVIFPNLKLAFTNGSVSGNYVSNNSGSYQYDVQAGSHTITPILENPSYFAISPPTINVNFPETASPFIQDFCVTPNGSHPDLEITLLPLDVARPGFDANYLLTYRNKGNQMLSGNINFLFNDVLSDVVSAVPTFTSQLEGNLNWFFADLNYLESRSILVTININSPVETPPVNSQDVLIYEVAIEAPGIDETPEDNATFLHQTVLNSFDPNDKTCLEGQAITPEMVGKYVRYMIRFENTGTFAAENIVVKDIIDTTKFDISSLIPINGSHAFETKISDTNKVEFIFKNINLPFDDANNDGYVVFKIKTRPTLVLGDSFSNSASIYFDYNFPIVTDPAVTSIAVLETKDFEFADYFTLYPNPANTILNIQSKKENKISSVSIYNVLGQLVLVNVNFDQSKSIDVSALKSGNYFIKIQSDQGVSHSKLIKQ